MTSNEVKQLVHEVLIETIEIYELPVIELTDDVQLLNTLGLTSIDIVHILGSIDMRLERHLSYDQLLVKNDTYVTDLSIGELISFIHSNYENSILEPKSME